MYIFSSNLTVTLDNQNFSLTIAIASRYFIIHGDLHKVYEKVYYKNLYLGFKICIRVFFKRVNFLHLFENKMVRSIWAGA